MELASVNLNRLYGEPFGANFAALGASSSDKQTSRRKMLVIPLNYVLFLIAYFDLTHQARLIDVVVAIDRILV